uniref:CAP n=1 Tax=Angiostrongylus cantonensis TaxID=6313 RepID=A0A0K0DK64_ANGCA
MRFDQIEQHSDSAVTSASQVRLPIFLKIWWYNKSHFNILESEETYQSQRSKSIKFHELPEQERLRIMRENLEKHRRNRAPVTTKPRTTSFNGPFFKLEETNISRYYYVTKSTAKERNKNVVFCCKSYCIVLYRDSSLVVIWPPPSEKTPRSQSVIPKTMTDPERIDEYRRQKNMEVEAMRRHEEEKLVSMRKQVRNEVGISRSKFVSTSVLVSKSVKQSSRMRVYETTPISVVSDERSNRADSAPPRSTWKRTYTVEKPREVAKNEILTSDQLLEKDQYHVDILKRRAAFVEKPENEPEIVRTGRRWQPPPEKPYVWPSFPRAASVDLELSQNDYNQVTSRSACNAEHRWVPVVNDPGYKREQKNFTPMNSPPSSPIRGSGTGPLDEAAKRQTKYVIQPSPDGSHRPKPAFRKERRAPSGGFYPHAPNAIKVVKRRSVSSQGLLTTDNVEIIHQNNYYRLDEGRMNEWDKIYDLPPHSSTIVGKDVPKNVNVKRRLSHFEGSVQDLQRRQESAQKLYSIDGVRFLGLSFSVEFKFSDILSFLSCSSLVMKIETHRIPISNRFFLQLGDPLPDPKAFSPSPGHTRRMIHSVTESTKCLDRSKNSQPLRDHKYSPGSQYL